MFWSDTAIQPDKLQRLKPFQRMNHFPGMYALARKNNLGKNLNKMRKRFEKDFKFYPKTWLLPMDANDLKL